MEIVVNALRKEVNMEDKCDLAIKRALEKGPKRVRIASREELKMEINNFKNISLRLMQTLKNNNVKVPSFASKINLETKEDGLREIAEDGKEGGVTDYLENMSVGDSQLSIGGKALDQNAGAEEQLNFEKVMLEERLNSMNNDLYEKNEKILELLQTIEDLKIQIFSRDKTVEI